MQHLAIIPDGNRRWAAANKLQSFFGHQRGMEKVRSAIKVCIRNGVKFLTFYTFSLENFNRSELEKNYLFNLLADGFTKELPDLIKNGIRVRFIGDRQLFPEKLKTVVQVAEEKTALLKTLQLNLLFCYGAKQEIASAARALAQQVKDGLLGVQDITEDTFHDALWTRDIPDPDLIVRTGNIVRLSNYLLYQAAYSEFVFLDCFWPEVTEEKLEQCVLSFKATQRNFGR